MGLGGDAGGGAQISGLGHWALAKQGIGHSQTLFNLLEPPLLKEVGVLGIMFF
jgi:hypothetical protein